MRPDARLLTLKNSLLLFVICCELASPLSHDFQEQSDDIWPEQLKTILTTRVIKLDGNFGLAIFAGRRAVLELDFVEFWGGSFGVLIEFWVV